MGESIKTQSMGEGGDPSPSLLINAHSLNLAGAAHRIENSTILQLYVRGRRFSPIAFGADSLRANIRRYE